MAEISLGEGRFFGSNEKLLHEYRLTLPASLIKGKLEEEVVATGWFEHFLIVCDGHSWRQVVQRLALAEFVDPDLTYIERVAASESERVTLERNSRIILPREIAQSVGIFPESTVRVIGESDRIEIWEIKRWEAYKRSRTIEERVYRRGVFFHFPFFWRRD